VSVVSAPTGPVAKGQKTHTVEPLLEPRHRTAVLEDSHRPMCEAKASTLTHRQPRPSSSGSAASRLFQPTPSHIEEALVLVALAFITAASIALAFIAVVSTVVLR
jgi:hypothetical protein